MSRIMRSLLLYKGHHCSLNQGLYKFLLLHLPIVKGIICVISLLSDYIRVSLSLHVQVMRPPLLDSLSIQNWSVHTSLSVHWTDNDAGPWPLLCTSKEAQYILINNAWECTDNENPRCTDNKTLVQRCPICPWVCGYFKNCTVKIILLKRAREDTFVSN